MSVARHGKGPWSRLAALLLALLAIGCATASRGINARLASVQADIDRALAEDELETARELALEFEYRLPGGDSYATLGDVLWRLGEFIEAEAFQRRAVEAGVPRGYRGLARADLARGRLDEAAAHARRAAELPEIAESSWLVVAGAEWAAGRLIEASEALAAASAGEGVLAQEAAIVAAAGVARGEAPGTGWRSPVDWLGGHAELAMTPAARVRVRVGGVEARLRIRLDESRSSISPQLARRVSVRDAEEGGAIEAPLSLGEIRTPSAIFRVAAPEGDEDGVLGFDLLSTLAWMIDVRAGVMQLSPGTGPLPAGIDPPTLAATHWTNVRVPRRGLGAQLLALPRVRGEVVRATIDLEGPSRVGLRVLPRLYRDDSAADAGAGEVVELELRVGAWRGDREWIVEDLLPLARGGRVAPQAVLGADFLSEWRLYWRPDRGDLRLERHDADAAGPIQ